jgi:putative copper export protein
MLPILLVALSWLDLVTLAFLIAVPLFRLFPVAEPAATRTHAAIIPPYVASLVAPGAALLLFTSAGQLLTLSMGTGIPLLGGFPEPVEATLRTPPGSVWLIRLTALIFLIILIALKDKERDQPWFSGVMLSLGIAITWTNSASGHAADKGHFTIQEMVDFIHLLSACIWGGGVFVLALLAAPRLHRQTDRIVIAEASWKFSRIAGYVVLLLLFTALYNARFHVGRFDALWSTAYGGTVAVKIFLLYVLLLVGGFNRYVNIPMLQQISGRRLEGPGGFGRAIGFLLDAFRPYLSEPVSLLFRKTLIIEVVFIAAVFLCAAMLRHETPVRNRHLEVPAQGPDLRQTEVPLKSN